MKKYFVITTLTVIGLFVTFRDLSETPVENPKLSLRSEEDLRKEWDDNYHKLIFDDLVGGKFAVEAVQTRFTELSQAIYSRYGKMWNLNISVAETDVCGVVAGCDLVDGTPTVFVFLRKLVSVQDELALNGERHHVAKCRVVLLESVMHEMEHLRLGTRPMAVTSTNLDEVIRDECLAWGATCRYTLVPLKQARVAMTYNEEYYLDGWNKSGQNENSPEWTNFIYNTYKHIKNK